MRIGLAGLGTVGTAVVRLLRAHGDRLAARGADLKIVAVAARDKSKPRDCDLTGIEWVGDASALARRGDIDCIIETIGGVGDVALDLTRVALTSGKHVVTANKAMIAAHGGELAALAEKNGICLSFEAAVCGGVPVVKMLREGLAANRIASLRGILNGTGNYILTRMAEAGCDFAAALAEATAQGYAESDPAADIDGRDSADKLAILAALAFGGAPDPAGISVTGIRGVTARDVRDAAAKGGRIKLIGQAMMSDAGLTRRVEPMFVPLEEPLARVGGVGNMIEITSDFAGTTRIGGIGAGGDATASAVVADLIDIACATRRYPFGLAASIGFGG